MNIFFRELKANRKALIIWSVCMVFFVLSGMAKYTAYSSGSSTEIFNKIPYSIKALLGMGSFDVTTMSGFFAFLFTYIALTIGIHAALLGSGIIAKEERDKTTEFLMVKPVSRTTVLSAKLLAALVNVVIINLVTLASSMVMVAAYNNGKSINKEISIFFLSMFIIQLIFLSLGAVLSAIIKKSKASGSIATGIIFGSYVIAKITDLTDHFNWLNVFSPFKYFSYTDIIDGKGLSFTITLLCIVLAAAFTVSTYFFYNKRDLNV